MGNIKKGQLIVIEGIDGVGKNTQAKRLADQLQTELGHTVELLSFPNYDSLSSGAVRLYLNKKIRGAERDQCI